MEHTAPDFQPLIIPRRIFSGKDANQYLVRGANGEIKEIQANTAYEAFLKSGLAQAYKIERSFSSSSSIVERAHLKDEDAAEEGSEEDMLAMMKRRRNPVLSPTELEGWMASLNAHAEGEVSHEVAPLTPHPMMAEDHSPQRLPDETPPPMMTDNPVGTEVHGDGFDEIIPSSMPVKPPAPLKAAEPRDDVTAQPSNPAAETGLPPQQELSQEDVTRLLGESPNE